MAHLHELLEGDGHLPLGLLGRDGLVGDEGLGGRDHVRLGHASPLHLLHLEGSGPSGDTPPPPVQVTGTGPGGDSYNSRDCSIEFKIV